MHATPFELERYLSDALAPEASAELERHCDGCDACAQALAKEARFELSLRRLFAEQRCGRSAELIPLPQPGEGARRAGGASPPSAAVLDNPTRRAPLYLLAAAACVTLAFFTAHLPTRAPAAAPSLTSDAGDAFHPTPRPAPSFFDGDLAHGTP